MAKIEVWQFEKGNSGLLQRKGHIERPVWKGNFAVPVKQGAGSAILERKDLRYVTFNNKDYVLGDTDVLQLASDVELPTDFICDHCGKAPKQ